jgi:transcriptional regulator with XRE-family HTH domain
MSGERDGASDRALAQILGQELRRARESKGFTRAELVAQLPSGIGDRTLLSYEHGTRTLSVARFIEICRALGVAATEILHNALEKARDLRAFSIKVDLEAILRDERTEFEPIRQWARNRLDGDDPSALVLLPPAAVRELAAVFGVTHVTLATYLIEFTPEDLSLRE